MTSDPPRRWKHRKGDTYMPVTHYPQCSADGPLWWRTSRLGDAVPSLPRALSHGARCTHSDDFNIAVINGGKVVGWLWSDEIVDDDPEFLAEMTREVCR